MLERFEIGHWLTLHGAIVLLGLAVYVTASRANRQRRHPSASVAWVISLLLVPYLALPAYFVFGSRKNRLRPAPLAHAKPLPALSPAGRLQALAVNLGLGPPVCCHDLRLHADGADALARLREIVLGARESLDVGTFLLGRDHVGRELSQLLARRAREGLKVRLLIDGVGLYLGGRPALGALQRAGAQVALFVPPWASFLPGRINLRNHRKLVVADGQWLWSGGRNLAAEYFTGKSLPLGHVAAPWIDLSFDVRGPIAADALAQFQSDWELASRGRAGAHPVRPTAPAPAGRATAQLVPSGPDQAEDTLYSLIIEACFTAQRRILAVTPYFVPDPGLLMAFTLAARRGVQVDLVLPRHSNHRLADLARPPAIRELVAAGAHVWLAPGMVHAKAVVVDEVLALAGSANLDERSLFLNYEMMVAFYDPQAVRGFAEWVGAVRATSTRVQAAPVPLARELAEGILRLLVFQL
ncbi:phospholipase D-like domain-containing protein [Caenimonas terrae]|uniref:Phospholipase D-like domain-containing protein n=1 Tax=Caenimonas terrae TaxID=696074 RepID=A0ABW0NH99_9BURK